MWASSMGPEQSAPWMSSTSPQPPAVHDGGTMTSTESPSHEKTCVPAVTSVRQPDGASVPPSAGTPPSAGPPSTGAASDPDPASEPDEFGVDEPQPRKARNTATCSAL